MTWHTRPEADTDIGAIREINLAAFPTPLEADLVEALRSDPAAWLPGLSLLATTADDTPVSHALLSRCHIGDIPALALAPCATVPKWQGHGAGTAAIFAALDAGRERGETIVIVLGHANYYPRFGFLPASRFGITAPFEVPDEAFMALPLHDGAEIPTGAVRYPPAFGV